MKLESNNDSFAHICKPLEYSIGKDKHSLLSESADSYAAIGRYATSGIPMDYLKPLIYRADFFKYCYFVLGEINEQIIKEYESNPEKFYITHQCI